MERKIKTGLWVIIIGAMAGTVVSGLLIQQFPWVSFGVMCGIGIALGDVYFEAWLARKDMTDERH